MLFSFIKEKDFTISFVGSIVLALVTSILLYINISFSEKHENHAFEIDDHHFCPYFWTMTFVLGSGMGLLTCWVLQALHWWNLCLGFIIWAGIYTFTHVTSHDTNLIEKTLEHTKVKEGKDAIFVEWLKLDHNCSQTAFQILLSSVGLFVFGGIAAYFIYQGRVWSSGMTDTVILSLWAVIGMWFGILGLLQKRMFLLRDKIRTLSSDRGTSKTSE